MTDAGAIDPVDPSTAETEAITMFCRGWQRKRVLEEESVDDIKNARLAHKAALGTVRQIMEDHGATSIDVGGDTCARLVDHKATRTLTRAMVSNAIAKVPDTMLVNPDPQAVANSIYPFIREEQTVTRRGIEFSKLSTVRMPSHPGSFTGGGADSRAATRAYQDAVRHRNDLKGMRDNRKDSMAQDMVTVRETEPRVRMYMERAQLNSQPINLTEDGAQRTYFLRRQTTRRRPKVTSTMIMTFLARAVRKIRETHGMYQPDMKGLRATMVDDIWTRVENRPHTEHTMVSLRPAKSGRGGE
jgi:hypothetical protein